ncbi:MAG: type III-A CRISPR-associated protein Csm2 [Fervidobacterium sp.]|nr:type III-A CRISPR-associated protein Csm2 [Fervidobacterium sp.]
MLGQANQGKINQSTLEEVEEDVKNILDINGSDPDGSKMIKVAEKYAKKVKDKLTMTQIRKVFNDISKLNGKENYKYKLNMILVNFLYNAKRSNYPRDFIEFFIKLLNETVNNGEEKLGRFKDFFEALVAYTKFYEKESLQNEEKNRK